MVSNLSMFLMALSALIAFAVPVVLAVYVCKKYKASVKAIFIGALIFFVFQMILRIPLLGILSKQSWYIQASTHYLWAIALFLGLTAGIFEEVGRFLGFKYLLKGRLNWKNGVAFGIGHGGIEAILLVGLGNINNIITSIMINSGTFDVLVGNKVPAEIVQQMKESLINTAPYIFALGGVERIFAIVIQIALSLIVLYGVMKKDFKYVIYAILLHTLLDSPLIYLMKLGYLPAELYVFICAGIGVFYIIKSRKAFEKIEGENKETKVQ